MTRHRARPSFTVEIKRTRTNPLPLPEADARQRAAQALWQGTALAEVTERLDEVFAPAAPAPVRVAVQKPVSLERRVLPSLIPAPEPEPRPAPEPVAELPIPRVRRPRPAPLRPLKPAAVEAEAVPAPALAPVAVAPAPAEAVQAPRSGRGYSARTKDALRPGERWKRRLPRVCW